MRQGYRYTPGVPGMGRAGAKGMGPQAPSPRYPRRACLLRAGSMRLIPGAQALVRAGAKVGPRLATYPRRAL